MCTCTGAARSSSTSPVWRRSAPASACRWGGTAIGDDALAAAIRTGVRKVNVGSALRSAFYRAVQAAIAAGGDPFNPYEVLGSGLDDDVLLAGRRAVGALVGAKMRLFGSAGRAPAGRVARRRQDDALRWLLPRARPGASLRLRDLVRRPPVPDRLGQTPRLALPAADWLPGVGSRPSARGRRSAGSPRSDRARPRRLR